METFIPAVKVQTAVLGMATQTTFKALVSSLALEASESFKSLAQVPYIFKLHTWFKHFSN